MISVCIPNLNGAPFLAERIRTIRAQTLRDYEVVIVDNHSDDGAYGIFQDYAAADDRVRLTQAPREGMYANWNNCLRLARGEWIYVATSDDTMTPDCLASLRAAAARNPDADVITSLPWIIDAGGRRVEDRRDVWARRVLGRRRVRSGWTSARTELLAAMIFGTPTLSVTQMLFHRRAFERVGLFPTGYGSTGDFAWQVRGAGQVKTYHLGRELGSWRRHASQATHQDQRPLCEIRGRILLDWFRDEQPALDAGLCAAFGFSLARAGLTAPAHLPPAVGAWTDRATRAMQRKSTLAKGMVFALLARAMTWEVVTPARPNLAAT